MAQEVTKRLPGIKRTSIIDNRQCAVIASLKVFATKWKPCIICYLAQQPLRFNELYRAIPNISRKVLSEHLHELEKDELIVRIQHDHKNQKVEYSLSEKGHSLIHIMEQIQNWGMKNIKGVLSIQEMIVKA